MNDNELAKFEAELKRLRPARLPESLEARLLEAQPAPCQPVFRHKEPSPIGWFGGLNVWLRWLAPVAAAMVAGLWIWRGQLSGPESPGSSDVLPIAVFGPALKADDVQIDQQLISTFDAIGQLPSGEPVRVRCEEWVDDVTMRDIRTGLMVQKKTPRFEIVGVRYDTY